MRLDGTGAGATQAAGAIRRHVPASGPGPPVPEPWEFEGVRASFFVRREGRS